MSKVLCIFAIVVSAILFLLFLVDLVAGIPFARANILMNIGFLFASGVVGFFSFQTLRELG
ncbi:MAG: hypothetical protein FWC50_16195 [Planctomycetaceae bacterium]|nr:hypothetical protein [Planctomycetaceae bacterium]